MRGARVRARSIAIVLVVSAAVACSGSDATPGTGDGSSGDGGGGLPSTASLSIADLTFEPSTLPIAPGSTEITITNADTTNHTFTLDDGGIDQPVDGGQSVTVTVGGESGQTIGYHCEIHASMTGTLQVA